MHSIHIRAPGRICLFGEHQDYLGYPTIAAAIDKYIDIYGQISEDSGFSISMPDISISDLKLEFPQSNQLLNYISKRDYLRSGINVAFKQGLKWKKGWNVKITGNIPINAGASSSSALVIAWIKFLYTINQQEIDSTQLGCLGYETEVTEFQEAGGMMDHFASAFGNVIYVESQPTFSAKYIGKPLTGFVLANSGVKKNTVDDLKRVKQDAVDAFWELREIYPKFDQFRTPLQEIQPYISSLSKSHQQIALGNLINRDITQQALLLFQHIDDGNLKHQKELGNLLYQHHESLSKKIQVSIPKIDKMVDIAMEAGAFGGKINGSGFGGTMFAYAPSKTEEVYQALKNAGYEAWKINISEGAIQI